MNMLLNWESYAKADTEPPVWFPRRMWLAGTWCRKLSNGMRLALIWMLRAALTDSPFMHKIFRWFRFKKTGTYSSINNPLLHYFVSLVSLTLSKHSSVTTAWLLNLVENIRWACNCLFTSSSSSICGHCFFGGWHVTNSGSHRVQFFHSIVLYLSFGDFA